MPLNLAIFDWDGTLVDSPSWAHQAMCAVFNYYGVEPPTLEIFLTEISSDFLLFYRSHGIPESATRQDLNVIWEQYLTEHPDGFMMRDGAKEALAFCHDAGMKTAIVSGTSPGTIAQGIERFALTGLIDHVEANACGKVGELQLVLARFTTNPHGAVYVDDTLEGVKAAKSLGITAIGITGGFELPERLLKANPDHLITTLFDLPQLL
jgi:phosphoglycolate phosphatase